MLRHRVRAETSESETVPHIGPYIGLWETLVRKFVFSAANPNSGIRARSMLSITVRIEHIGDVGIDCMIVTLPRVLVHICGIV